MDEQKKYEVIKSLADHPHPNKQRAAITLDCTVRHINRMLKGYKEQGKEYFIHGTCLFDVLFLLLTSDILFSNKKWAKNRIHLLY